MERDFSNTLFVWSKKELSFQKYLYTPGHCIRVLLKSVNCEAGMKGNKDHARLMLYYILVCYIILATCAVRVKTNQEQ